MYLMLRKFIGMTVFSFSILLSFPSSSAEKAKDDGMVDVGINMSYVNQQFVNEQNKDVKKTEVKIDCGTKVNQPGTPVPDLGSLNPFKKK